MNNEMSADMPDKPLRIAVPKGSLYKESVDLLTQAGLDTTGLDNPGRQLIFRNNDVEFVIVRPTDAPVFAAFGGSDCGICGADSLVEANLDLVEMVDLRYGACRFIVAEPADAAGRAQEAYERNGVLRIGSKYPRITQMYYDKLGIQTEIIKLHGNVELGPIVGMCDRLVDITATGTTLRENNLVIVDDVMEASARFFANPAAARINPRVRALAARLDEIVKRSA